MPSFLADENFDNRILEGLFLRKPNIDAVTVRDVGLHGRKDPNPDSAFYFVPPSKLNKRAAN